MPVDDAFTAMLSAMAPDQDGDIDRLSPAQLRAWSAESRGALSEPGAEVASVEDTTVPTSGGPVPVRVYRPVDSGPGPTGALVWMHGGGWVIGDLETADPIARNLSAGAGLVVVSVDYPLAPEHPFPAARDACLEVTAWVADHGDELGVDRDRIAVGGDSAGGNLAAVVALAARDRAGPPIAFQLLVYPAVDALGSYPSVRENGEGYFLTASMMTWFGRHYAGDGDVDLQDPALSPIYAEDLADLPPALVITAEFDPLRDEGEAFALRLRQAGVPVEVSRYDGMIHGFFAMTKVTSRAGEAMAEAVGALRRALA